MFERFTPAAREIVREARNSSKELGHRWTGTEHLLLAVAASETAAGDIMRSHGLDPASITAEIRSLLASPMERDREALGRLGIDVDDVRRAVLDQFGPGVADLFARGSEQRQRSRGRRRPDPRCGFTRRARKALELSLREAIRLESDRIDSEHVALGLLRATGGLAELILARRSMPIDSIRMALEVRSRRAA